MRCADAAEAMSGDKRTLLKQWLASGKAQLHPLTFPQREIWETSPVAPGSAANHICCLIDVRGAISPEASKAALQRVVDRQDVLRLSFLPGKEQPFQLIRQSAEANLHYHELSESETSDQAIEERAAEIFARPFDLLQGPLYRAEVLRRGSDHQVFVFAIHHAIADGWTLGVFVQDLCVAYAQGLLGLDEPLPPVPQTYAAWGASERAFWQPAEIEPRVAFWKAHLAGSPRMWDALEAQESAAEPLRRWVTWLPAEVADAARDLARVSGATLFSTLFAAFQAAFSQWTGRPDILVGTPVANRTTQTVRETMGYCAGIVPLRGRVERDRSFSDSLRSVHQSTVDCLANAMPFAELATALGERRTPGHNPVFEVRFALQNHPVPEVSLRGFSAKLSMRSTGTARFQIGCEITDAPNGFEVVWLYRSKLFSQKEMENLKNLFYQVIEGACRSPQSTLAVLMN